MGRKNCAGVFLAAFVCFLPARPRAEETRSQGELDSLFQFHIASSDVWRGEVLNDALCLQPSFYLFSEKLSFELWGTTNLEGRSGENRGSRINAMLGHMHHGNEHLFNSGVIAHYFPNRSGHRENTAEIFLGYGLDIRLLPSVVAYYDFVDVNGLYVAASLRRIFPLIEDELHLHLQMQTGWADATYAEQKFSLPRDSPEEERAFVPNGSAFIDTTLALSMPIRLNEKTRFTPSVKYMRLMDKDLRSAFRDAGADADKLSFSIGLEIDFF